MSRSITKPSRCWSWVTVGEVDVKTFMAGIHLFFLKKVVDGNSNNATLNSDMNNFACLTEDEIGKLATMSTMELDIDNYMSETATMTTEMTAKEKYKLQNRENRIAARIASGDDFGVRCGQLFRGEVTSTFDNSHLWSLRDQIAKEVEPEIRKRQIAWANSMQA